MDGIIEVLSSPKELERIGTGFCGSVWSAHYLPFCIKREDGGPHRSLYNEKVLQVRVNERIVATSEDRFLVPRCYGYLSKDNNDIWSRLLDGFPAAYEACNAMISDTIQPIQASARKQIIKRYCPDESQAQIFADSKNRHCLLRLYLGRRRQASQRNGRRRFFSLRNFPLHMDQVEELELPATEYARVIARGLAFINWSVDIDGNDVEFVLAPPRPQPIVGTYSQQIWDSFLIGQHSMWLLDFDCCRQITFEHCVDQIARSFWRNDPYFPRPSSESPADQCLWREFMEEYKRASTEMIPTGPFGEKLRSLVVEPASLVAHVLERIEESRDEYIGGKS